ncbi:MAG: alpha/beta fold hydrolase [Bacteroidales bacterium]|nr:alpha/beta fold hydrolase [Bacteroidales bacterium]
MKTSLFLFFLSIIGFHSIVAQEVNILVTEKELSFDVDNVTISGTLTIPKSEKPVPIAILISGSFADNRDAEAYGFKPFKEICDYFASEDIATFRYDDRGVGKSTGKHTYQYEIKELVNDVQAAINLLKKEDKINNKQIGLIGHSLGGMMAPMIASENKDVSFIISMAGPVDEPNKINIRYREKNLIQSGWKQEDIEKALEIEKRIVDVTVTGKGYYELMEDIKNQSRLDYERLSVDHKSRYSNWEDYYKKSWYGLMEPFINTPFLRSFYTHKPKEYLEKLKCPALFLFGERDDQIRILDSGPIIIEALEIAGNNNYSIRQFPEAGHYFVRYWSKSEIKFAPGFVTVMSNWIHERIEY